MYINHQINTYLHNHSSILSKNSSAKSSINTKEQAEIPNEELLKEVRKYYNYPILDGKRMIFLISEPSTYIWKQEIATKSASIGTSTKDEYEESLRFLEKQMDKIMAEVARENYDLIKLAKQIEKVEFTPKERREYTQKEKDLMGDRGVEGYTKLIYIMEAYSVRELRENPPAILYTQEEAKNMAINHSLPQEDYSVFFSHVADRLSPKQRREIIEAIAKVQAYEEKNGAQIYNILLKKNQDTGHWEYSSLINQVQNPIMEQYSNLASQALIHLLDQGDRLQNQNFDMLDSTTNSIMQTLLKDSKEAK